MTTHKGEIGFFDLARILFAFLVFLSHYGKLVPCETFEGGAFSVQFFFILAGALECKSIYNHSDGGLWNLLGRKIKSIFPTYLICYFIVLIERFYINHLCGVAVGETMKTINWKSAILEMLMLQNLYDCGTINSLGWYMSAYFIAIIVWICFSYIFLKWKRIRIFVYMAIPFMYYFYCHSRGLYFNSYYRIEGILYGISGVGLGFLTYEIFSLLSDNRYLERIYDLVTILSLVFALLTTFISRYSIEMRYISTIFMCIFVYFSLKRNNTKVDKLINCKVIHFGGKMTFSFYLLQVVPMLWYQLGMCEFEEFRWIYFCSVPLLSMLVVLVIENVNRMKLSAIWGKE